MNNYFNEEVIRQYYPETEELMLPSMLIWKLPAGKEHMLSEICSKGDYFLEEKIDGAFYQFVKTNNYSYLFGRTISKENQLLSEKGANVPHIMSALDCLPPNTIIIGEIYVPGGTSKDTTTIMGCLPDKAIKRQENDPIHYYLHDIIFYDGVNLMCAGAEDRYKILAAIWNKHNLGQYNFLRLAEKVDTNLEEEISRILKSGGEGVVLKKRDSIYVPSKRPAWCTIKVKQMDSIDLVCMGFCSATREYTGKEIETWPYWAKKDTEEELLVEGNYYGQDGWEPVTKPYFLGWKTAIEVGAYNEERQLIKLGTISSGLNDEIKQDLVEHPESYLNRVCSLDCMSIDKRSKTLRHPVFRCWRDDKSAQDCIISEVFNED